MRTVAGIVGVLLLTTVLWDAFETVVLPRRVNRRLRLTSLFYRATWAPFSASAALFKSVNRREAYLSLYGPLSLVMLLGLWAVGLITAFALLHYGAGSAVALASERPGLLLDFYMSGSTFFTLGLGDVAPVAWRSRLLTIVEAGMGFGFLALVIGYFPVTYQAFSSREKSISLLDARAGSPPSAGELLRRHRGPDGRRALESVLHEWEQWAAEVLETHLSYPMLAYFRSQHTNESWIAALTTILDASALLIADGEGAIARQARLTFAIARHAVVDLAQVFSTPPEGMLVDRLPPSVLDRLRAELEEAGMPLARGAEVDARLADLRRLCCGRSYVAVAAAMQSARWSHGHGTQHNFDRPPGSSARVPPIFEIRRFRGWGREMQERKTVPNPPAIRQDSYSSPTETSVPSGAHWARSVSGSGPRKR